MATVVLHAALPSVRLGLAAMLAERGHQIVQDEEADAGSVWVVDAPDAATLAWLGDRRYAEVPRAAVVLTDEAGVPAVLVAAGLRGWACLGRDVDGVELDLAVRAAEASLVVLDLPAASQAIRSPAAGPRTAAAGADSLTPRELQVLQLVAQGLPNKAIARSLGISEHTAKFHVSALCAKLGAASRTEAVAIGARAGLIVL